MPILTRLRSADYRRTRWKNGGGWTTEIATDASPESDAGTFSNFCWRISIADIEQDGSFSTFPDVDRTLMLLDGNGIELDIDNTPCVRLRQRFEQVHFAGESKVQCRLLAGATRDFNVMVRRDVFSAEVSASTLFEPKILAATPKMEWLIYILAGHMEACCNQKQMRLEQGDTLSIRFDANDLAQVSVKGDGKIVSVKLTQILTEHV